MASYTDKLGTKESVSSAATETVINAGNRTPTGFVTISNMNPLQCDKLTVTNTLAELRETAPTFCFEAKTLVDELKLARALAKINYAISLQPENAAFYALKGNILQSMLQFSDARDAFARAVDLDPEHELPFAEINLNLCERLLAGGAPGLHFYSMNQAAATTAIWQRLHSA